MKLKPNVALLAVLLNHGLGPMVYGQNSRDHPRARMVCGFMAWPFWPWTMGPRPWFLFPHALHEALQPMQMVCGLLAWPFWPCKWCVGLWHGHSGHGPWAYGHCCFFPMLPMKLYSPMLPMKSCLPCDPPTLALETWPWAHDPCP